MSWRNWGTDITKLFGEDLDISKPRFLKILLTTTLSISAPIILSISCFVILTIFSLYVLVSSILPPKVDEFELDSIKPTQYASPVFNSGSEHVKFYKRKGQILS